MSAKTFSVIWCDNVDGAVVRMDIYTGVVRADERGDTVYLWWNPHSEFYGWGEVIETLRTIWLIGLPRTAASRE
jgi:hypothetical protein